MTTTTLLLDAAHAGALGLRLDPPAGQLVVLVSVPAADTLEPMFVADRS